MSTYKISSEYIKDLAYECGFTQCGIAPARLLSEAQRRFEKSIQKGYHSGMHFLERNIQRRFTPSELLPNCRSVVVLTLNYNTALKFSEPQRFAKFSLLNDYHNYMHQMLKKLLASLKDKHTDINAKATVDTSAISEKNWAVEAGLGFIGKNGLLITPYGSFVHIGTLLLDKEVDNYDKTCEKSCSNCNRCIECCPTHAIEEAHCVNANHCIAYQTIENKNPDLQILNKESWIYGCDVCQEVCPANRNIPTNEDLVSESSLLLQLTFEQLSQLSQTEFNHYFRDSGIKRRKHSIFMEIIKNKEQ